MIGFLLDNIIFLGYLSLSLVGIIVLLFAFLAPFESLLWWKHLKIEPAKFIRKLKKFEDASTGSALPDIFIVYLSGIGLISGNGLEADEQAFIEKLAKKFPHAAIVSDVFPYSPDLQTLSSDKFFSRLWKYLERNRLTNRKNILDSLVMIRNMMQVAVSSDRRYAPVYDLGTTNIILEGLLKKGYDLKNQKPICFVGYSGGAQIALGAANYLSKIIQAPISLIGIAGAISDDPGLDVVDQIDYLYSPQDPVHILSSLVFFGRYRCNVFSHWNEAKQAGKVTFFPLGKFAHMHARGYFDNKTYLHPHQTYFEKMWETLVPLIEEKLPLKNHEQTIKFLHKNIKVVTPLIDPLKETILMDHGRKTEHVIIMLHGYTNSPPQFHLLGNEFYEKGFNVYIPVLPFHEDKEEYYKQQGNMSPTNLERTLDHVINTAHQLGNKIHIMGLSLGGVLTCYAAQTRNDIESIFVISPFLRLRGVDTKLGALLRFLPNIYLPWSLSPIDPKSSAYSHFSLKGVGDMLSLGNTILSRSSQQKPHVKHATFLLNSDDHAVSPKAVQTVVDNWSKLGFTQTTVYEIPKGMAPIHDIIDPSQKRENIGYVYPLILDLFFKKER